ncbi:6351_t:CDS:2 [Entrophospora sp. SA101]|nr:6351_t:CDS:2 [Entrophospora sp. SA101]CAJ0840633.1 17539_t:CDS:2 [Entrophospora sp. SA101]CAJ0913240.1 16412_t:CDS:2 [Entrophospora sp. SA101]
MSCNKDLEKFKTEMELLYERSPKNDYIRIGVIDLQDTSKNRSNIYKYVKNKLTDNTNFSSKFEEFISSIADLNVIKLLESTKKFNNLDDIINTINTYQKFEDYLSFNQNSIFLKFILDTLRVYSNTFGINEEYFDQNLSEPHIAAILYTPMFFSLFRSKEFNTEICKEHLANKYCRNIDNDSRTKLGLVPDIKIKYKRKSIETLCVEHAKKIALLDLPKSKRDYTKLQLLLHNQIHLVSEILSKKNKLNEIYKFKSFGIRTSGLELKSYVMYLKHPQLYIFEEIFSTNLPTNIYNYHDIYDTLVYLMLLRDAVDKNHKILLDVLSNKNNHKNNTLVEDWVVDFEVTSPLQEKEGNQEKKSKKN